MSIQQLNDARTIADTANRLGAKLPKEIAAGMKHLEEIRRTSTNTPHAGHAAREIVPLLGKPAEFTKARHAAALELATGEALAKIDSYLTEACGAHLFLTMRRDRDIITKSIGEALAPDLATLQTEAPKLPELFRPEWAADLDPESFAAWTRASEAYQRVHATAFALAVLYQGATKQDSSTFTPLAALSLRFAKPGPLATDTDGFKLRAALDGKAERKQGLAGQGSTFVDGLFIPTALARAGATFEWATPSEIADRAQAIVTSITPRQHALAR